MWKIPTIIIQLAYPNLMNAITLISVPARNKDDGHFYKHTSFGCLTFKEAHAR